MLDAVLIYFDGGARGNPGPAAIGAVVLDPSSAPPQRLAAVSERTGSPALMTMLTGIVVAIIAGFVPLREIAELANAGTLIAFIAVAVCMMVLRVRAPTQRRDFVAPLPWVIGPLAVVG